MRASLISDYFEVAFRNIFSLMAIMSENEKNKTSIQPDWLKGLLKGSLSQERVAIDEEDEVEGEGYSSILEYRAEAFEDFANSLAVLLSEYDCAYKLCSLGDTNAEILITPGAEPIKIQTESSEASEKGRGNYWNWRAFDHLNSTILVYSKDLRRNAMPDRERFQVLLSCDGFLSDPAGFLQVLENQGLQRIGEHRKMSKPKPGSQPD